MADSDGGNFSEGGNRICKVVTSSDLKQISQVSREFLVNHFMCSFYITDMALDVDMLTEEQNQMLNTCATQYGMDGTDYVEYVEYFL